MTGEEKLKEFTNNCYQKTITKVNDHIYHFLGYGHSNASIIIGETSVILVDVLDSNQRAERLKAEIAKITSKPIQTIIYTHGHPDHRGGAGAFQETVQEIIAFAPRVKPLKYYERLNDVLNQRGQYQHGYGLTDEEAISQGIGIREGKEMNDGDYQFLAPTTIYHQDIEREIDGIKVKLVSAPGETDDQILIWLEDDKVILTGDNYYGCWPNLYAIRGTQYRDIATWVETLETILSYPAQVLLPGHTKPLLSSKEIQATVGSFKDALESILLQTLDCMNQGMSISETIAAVCLPDELKNKDFLEEYYGTIEWSIKSIYCGYVGWFDGKASHLLPLSDSDYALTLLDLIDNDDVIIQKIKECIEKQEYQTALQLIEMILYKTNTKEIRLLEKEALLGRAKQITSANARHYYIASAKDMK